MEALRELEKMGYFFQLKGEQVRFKHIGESKPDPAVVRPLLEELKARKSEAIRYLQAREKVIDFATEAKKVRETLQRTGLAKIYSETLGETVYFAKDDQAAKRAGSTVVYTIDELRLLAGVNREDLRQIHQAKKLFGGKIVN